MYITIILFIVVILIVILALSSQKGDSIPYKKRVSLVNEKERDFFYALEKQIPSSYYVFPKINADKEVACAEYVDLLICDSYLRPTVAVKIVNNKNYDARSAEVSGDVKLPLVLVNLGLDLDYLKYILKIKEYLYK